MKLSTWWQLLELYEVILVWPLALVTLYLVAKAKTRRSRIVGASLLVLWFVPFIHRALGDVYFDYLCKHEAGEFIYRTVDNVEGILQMRPRDGSKDYFDRMAMGDIPEDPWGHTNWEAQKPETLFVNPPWSNYQYFEQHISAGEDVPRWDRGKTEQRTVEPNARFKRYFGFEHLRNLPMFVDRVREARSSYGYSWESKQSFLHQVFNIHPGEIRVIELKSQEVLGRRIGFYRTRPMRICPSKKEETLVYEFVSKVARPSMRDTSKTD